MNTRMLTGWLTRDAALGYNPKGQARLSFDVHQRDVLNGVEFTEHCLVECEPQARELEPRLLAGAAVVIEGEQAASKGKDKFGRDFIRRYIRVRHAEVLRTPKRATAAVEAEAEEVEA